MYRIFYEILFAKNIPRKIWFAFRQHYTSTHSAQEVCLVDCCAAVVPFAFRLTFHRLLLYIIVTMNTRSVCQACKCTAFNFVFLIYKLLTKRGVLCLN